MAAAALPRASLAAAPAERAHPERVRLGAFAALGLFAALHWGALIRPARGGEMLLSLIVALAGGAILIALPAQRPEWQRRTAAGVLAFLLLVLALLVAGVPIRMFGWRNWGELVSGMSQGISSTPAITVPYRGLDEWVRIAILSGGTALLALASLLAFWPRRAATPGYPIAAAVALGTLYAVPIIEHGPDSPYLDGLMFCILLAGFLWLERVRPDQLAVAAACVRRHRRLRGDPRAAPGQHAAVVQLRGLRREARAQQGPGVLLEPQLRPADLAARRARDAAHQGQGACLLEGDQPRRLRRRALARGAAVARLDGRSAPEPQLAADDQRHRPRPALDPVRGRGRRPGHPARRLAPGPAAERRHLRDLEQTAAPRRQLPGAGLRPAPQRAPARALGHQLPGLHAGLPRAARAAGQRLAGDRGPGERAVAGPQRPAALRRLWDRGRGAGRVAQRLRRRPRRRTGHGGLTVRPALRADPGDQAVHRLALRVRAGRPESRAGGDDV